MIKWNKWDYISIAIERQTHYAQCSEPEPDSGAGASVVFPFCSYLIPVFLYSDASGHNVLIARSAIFLYTHFVFIAQPLLKLWSNKFFLKIIVSLTPLNG